MAERIEPQLAMQAELTNLPAVVVPDGYVIRTFREGEEGVWEEIVGEAFGYTGERCSFEARMRSKPSYLPERVLLVERAGRAVGTATALRIRRMEDGWGYLHMVAVWPGERGKGLGRAVCLAALHKMADEGARRCLLRTDDFRLPAIATYLDLGFVPVLADEGHRERWRLVFAAMGRSDELEGRFAGVLAGPVYEV